LIARVAARTAGLDALLILTVAITAPPDRRHRLPALARGIEAALG